MTLRSAFFIALRLAALVGLIWCAILLADWVKEALNLRMMPHTETMAFRLMLISLLVYALLLALPFVPGAEIGLTLIAVFGAGAAPLVYLATVVGLCLSYAVGGLVPVQATSRGLERLRLPRIAALVRRAEARDNALADATGSTWGKTLVRHRHLAFGLLLNVPGNVALGGGGGLALMAGLSRTINPLGFVVTVAIAVAPVPFAVYVLGFDI